MARIDSRHPPIYVDAKRGHRPIRLTHPHTGPRIAPAPDPRAARTQQRAQARARASQRFAAAFASARERVSKAAG